MMTASCRRSTDERRIVSRTNVLVVIWRYSTAHAPGWLIAEMGTKYVAYARGRADLEQCFSPAPSRLAVDGMRWVAQFIARSVSRNAAHANGRDGYCVRVRLDPNQDRRKTDKWARPRPMGAA